MMGRKTSPVSPVAASAGDMAKPLVTSAPSAKGRKPVNWARINVVFHRLLAVAWMVHGLVAWSIILGIDPAQPRPFEARAATFQAVTIYFAVVDLLSVVGLWLLAPWGSVVWLIAAVSQLVLAFVFPAAAAISMLGAGAIATCIVLFMTIIWMASRGET
jgi:Family of unknown function (DUF6163)